MIIGLPIVLEDLKELDPEVRSGWRHSIEVVALPVSLHWSRCEFGGMDWGAGGDAS